MRQAVTIPVPTPPTPPTLPQGQSLGDQIGEAARAIAQNALAQARSEIQTQLNSALAEQAALQAQLDARPSGPARRELTQELRTVDLKVDRLQEALAKLESKTATTTRTTAKVAQRTFPGTATPSNFDFNPPNNFDPTSLVFGTLGILFVAFPLTLAIVRFLWKRASNAPAPAITAEQTRRFDRIEQSVDAIAIEVERISENQRYLTKLLGENKKQGIGAG